MYVICSINPYIIVVDCNSRKKDSNRLKLKIK